MLRIPCPWCGPRDEIEFHWRGDARVERPLLDATDATWADYLFVRGNPKGSSDERWHHWAGCRQWFILTRDTVTHEIHHARKLEDCAR
jgi:sarcosine oxidase subunit delta